MVYFGDINQQLESDGLCVYSAYVFTPDIVIDQSAIRGWYVQYHAGRLHFRWTFFLVPKRVHVNFTFFFNSALLWYSTHDGVSSTAVKHASHLLLGTLRSSWDAALTPGIAQNLWIPERILSGGGHPTRCRDIDLRFNRLDGLRGHTFISCSWG